MKKLCSIWVTVILIITVALEPIFSKLEKVFGELENYNCPYHCIDAINKIIYESQRKFAFTIVKHTSYNLCEIVQNWSLTTQLSLMLYKGFFLILPYLN